jgi:hypothetical protein
MLLSRPGAHNIFLPYLCSVSFFFEVESQRDCSAMSRPCSCVPHKSPCLMVYSNNILFYLFHILRITLLNLEDELRCTLYYANTPILPLKDAYATTFFGKPHYSISAHRSLPPESDTKNQDVFNVNLLDGLHCKSTNNTRTIESE